MHHVEHLAWERLPHESSKAYFHFCIYLRLGMARSFTKILADSECVSKIAQIRRWSSRYEWVDRSRQYDDNQRRETRIKNDKALDEMKDRHAKLGSMALTLVQDSLVKKLRRISQELKEGQIPDELHTGEMTRLLDIAVKVERLSRGEAAEEGPLNDPMKELIDQMRQINASTPKDPALIPPQG